MSSGLDSRADRVGQCRRVDCRVGRVGRYQLAISGLTGRPISQSISGLTWTTGVDVDYQVVPAGRRRRVDYRVDQVRPTSGCPHAASRPGSRATCSQCCLDQVRRLVLEAHCSDDCLRTRPPHRRPARHRRRLPRCQGRLMAGRRRHCHYPHSADQESFAHRVSMVVRRLLVVIRRSIPDQRLAEHLPADRVRPIGNVASAGPITRVRPIGNVASAGPISGPRTWATCPASANYPSMADCLQLAGRHSVFERSK